MRRTKIVCTIGPACDSPAKINELIRSGMSVARLNFSHGTHPSHALLVKRIRAAAKSQKRHVAILQDLQGPKIRVGILPESGIRLVKGEECILTTRALAYNPKIGHIGVSYAGMHKDLKPKDRLLLDDGLLELQVTHITDHEIHTKVIVGGLLTSHKGVNVPTAHLHVSPLTKKDLADLAFGLKLGVDWIALSFVTSADEVTRLKKLIQAGWKFKTPLPKVIVKVEKHEALKNFDAILEVADGIMVARGDLGIETPAVRVPLEQKQMIIKSRIAAKPVVVATQMLDSMIRNPRPTRAEISDVANAVIDHTDATMLSGETATGKYPIQSVRVMAETAQVTESSAFDNLIFSQTAAQASGAEKILRARVDAAMQLVLESGATALVIASDTGLKVRVASSLRQEVRLIALVPNDALARQLSLSWGVECVVTSSWNSTNQKTIKNLLIKQAGLKAREKAVFLAEPKNAGAILV